MSYLRRPALPSLWKTLIIGLVATVAWVWAVETQSATSLLQQWITPNNHISWWLLPPWSVLGLGWLGLWLQRSLAIRQQEREQQQHVLQEQQNQLTAEHAAKQQTLHQQFYLEVRQVALLADGKDQSALWPALDTGPLHKDDDEPDGDAPSFMDQAAITLAKALKEWVTYWPIPILMAGPEASNPSEHFASLTTLAELDESLFIQLDEHRGEGADQLWTKVFNWFDEHPSLPAALLWAVDGRAIRTLELPHSSEILDNHALLLVTRQDRLDNAVRPYATPTPYPLQEADSRSHCARLLAQFQNMLKTEQLKTGVKPLLLPTPALWHPRAEQLINELNHDEGQASRLPGWEQGKAGFQPSVWVPVRWTTWQLNAFDQYPVMCHLHRPVEVNLTSDENKPLTQAAKVTVLQSAWETVLRTAPTHSPAWLWYDTGHSPENLIPLSLALTASQTDTPLDPTNTKHSTNLFDRLSDIGICSPLTLVGLATLKCQEQGTPGTIVHFHQADRVSIMLVSPAK